MYEVEMGMDGQVIRVEVGVAWSVRLGEFDK
jgi:hypothetical protein